MDHMMTQTETFLAFKFGQEDHINQFVKKGELYCNTIDHFRKIEDDNLRGDRVEGSTAVYSENYIQNNKYFNITLGDGPNKITINKEDLIGPVSIYNTEDDDLKSTHIFSMANIYNGLKIRSDNKIFDPRVLDFGDTMAMVTDLKSFKDRITKACKIACNNGEILTYAMRPVEYVANDHDSGWGIFNKFEKYAWQQEVRLALSVPDYSPSKPFVLKLGPLEDICRIIKTNKFKNQVHIDAKTGRQTLRF